MKRIGTNLSTTLTKLPKCNFCKNTAKYDQRLADCSQWAYMCASCALKKGCGVLGTGYGQELVLRDTSGSSEPEPPLVEDVKIQETNQYLIIDILMATP